MSYNHYLWPDGGTRPYPPKTEDLWEMCRELTAERNRIWLTLHDALNSFRLTQNCDDYPRDHWCNRAVREIEDDA